jgi:23S rRNA-/tRNA-specific pseudouridylate synthase
LLELELVTGRTHQIRAHASGAGAPILGDRAHGGLRRITHASGRTVDVGRPMLHAMAAALEEAGSAAFAAVDPAPEDLREVWRTLDGDPAAWEGWRPPWERTP